MKLPQQPIPVQGHLIYSTSVDFISIGPDNVFTVIFALMKDPTAIGEVMLYYTTTGSLIQQQQNIIKIKESVVDKLIALLRNLRGYSFYASAWGAKRVSPLGPDFWTIESHAVDLLLEFEDKTLSKVLMDIFKIPDQLHQRIYPPIGSNEQSVLVGAN